MTYAGPTVAARSAAREEVTSGVVRLPAVRIQERQVELIPDDRDNIQADDATLLIVEDEPSYCRVLVDMARGSGFKVLVAMRGADALELARKYHPTAVSLDVFLPDMLGWTVLSQLKQDPNTRHIPVQLVTLDEDRQHGLARGAFSFITKPTSSRRFEGRFLADQGVRRRLAIGGCWWSKTTLPSRSSIRALLEHDDIEMETASSGEEALAALHERAFDCVVLDLRLPDISGFEVLEQLSKNESLCDLPIVVFTGKELTPEEDARLHSIARSIVVKGVESPERLLDETALFLHRVVANLPEEKQQMIERLHRSDDDLVGKPVLVVDDDVRNIFALSSVLERRGMKVVSATTGHEAMALLDSTPDVSIVLMDIMMPEMDGYQTIKYIRQNPKHRRLPIIALTAKAMKGDREKCLEAGASEYLAKPVNTEQLLSALRMWLHR